MPVDILILSNGPGELATWVRPVVQQIRQQLGSDSPMETPPDRSQVRISVVLSPCPHATGRETAIARSYPEIDRVQEPEHFWRFLLWGKTAANWDWRQKGIVVFLGGDQFFTVAIAKRLGYRSVVYAEWEARWLPWIDRFGAMKPEIVERAGAKYASKFTVVGDLMAEVRREARVDISLNSNSNSNSNRVWSKPVDKNEIPQLEDPPQTPPFVRGGKEADGVFKGGLGGSSATTFDHTYSNPAQDQTKIAANFLGELEFSPNSQARESIGLLPGSKPAKLAQGVPLVLAIAESIRQKRPQTDFVIPVAPTVDLQTLARFANPAQNPLIEQMGATGGRLIIEELTTEPEKSQPEKSQPEKSQPEKSQPNQKTEKQAFLETPSGLRIRLWTQTPAYDLLSQCHLCLTTVGANTAELGSLAVPAIVLLPAYQLDAMRAWDGIPGILVNLPGVGSLFAKLINWLVLRGAGAEVSYEGEEQSPAQNSKKRTKKRKLFAWPNIWAKEPVVPELVGKLEPEAIARVALDLLEHPEKLAQTRDSLRRLRGELGASQKLAQIIGEELQ
ncbi:MAG: lipid-A-disaccharide synthase [Oscillatoria sp. SIO1A7]|nr:lipid-A-disaccharide synthase [Oscillatoria sp. SIO1A7]